MINKKIHYCWFGGNPLDERAIQCLRSWKKFFPDYEIIRWDESNFDISRVDFMYKAYKSQKWAFVSDVARLLILYDHGGIYFDVDVEVIRSYDDILNEETKAFIGMECDGYVSTGLGFGAEQFHPFLKKNIEIYEQINFDDFKTHLSDIACPILTTTLLEKNGFIKENRKQYIEGFEIYPSKYFAPMNYKTGKLKVFEQTHSIHWYSASWQDDNIKQAQEYLRKLSSIFGVRIADQLYGITTRLQQEGICKYLTNRIKKLIRKVK